MDKVKLRCRCKETIEPDLLNAQDALVKLEDIKQKIAFMADAVISWPAKACDPDDDEIMGADLIFKDIMKQIDDIGNSLETHIKQAK